MKLTYKYQNKLCSPSYMPSLISGTFHNQLTSATTIKFTISFFLPSPSFFVIVFLFVIVLAVVLVFVPVPMWLAFTAESKPDLCLFLQTFHGDPFAPLSVHHKRRPSNLKQYFIQAKLKAIWHLQELLKIDTCNFSVLVFKNS